MIRDKMREGNIDKRTSAYFTVEAAMVLMLVMSVLIMLIYMMFFQYDRCLAEQDMGALALKGCSIQAESKEELLKELQACATQIDMDKYIAWEPGKVNIELKGNKIKVEQTGSLRFPFAGMSLVSVGENWEIECVYENKGVSPISFLRNYRKISGGK